MLVWLATYLLICFPTFLLLDLSTKNHAISIFVLLNMFTWMQTSDSLIAPWKTNLQSYSTGYYSFLISNHWLSLLILFRFCSSLSFFLFLSKIKCITVLILHCISYIGSLFLPDLFKVKLSSLCCNLESLQVEMKPLLPKLHMKPAPRAHKNRGFVIRWTIFISDFLWTISV